MLGPTAADLLGVAQAAVQKARAAERDLLTRIEALQRKRSGLVKSDIAALDAELAVVRHDLADAQKDADVQLALMRAEAAEQKLAEREDGRDRRANLALVASFGSTFIALIALLLTWLHAH